MTFAEMVRDELKRARTSWSARAAEDIYGVETK